MSSIDTYKTDTPNYYEIETNTTLHHIMDKITLIEPNDNHIYQTDPLNLTFQGQKTLEFVHGTLFNNETIVFIGEKETHGDFDKQGPLEYYWHLYVFATDGKGGLIKRYFYREFDWRHYNGVYHYNIPYIEVPFTDSLVEGKCFHW